MACRLAVRAGQELKQWETDEWTTLVGIAVLSAEPETFSEWFCAMRRYQPDHDLDRTASAIQSLDKVPSDWPWCLIDLDSKTVVAGSGYDLPDRCSAYEPTENETVEGFPIVWLNTPADWEFRIAGSDWQQQLTKRLAELQQAKRLEVRSVLFGLPLFEFLADRVLAATTSSEPLTREQQQEVSRTIHAQWMLTAREDLGGKSPRMHLLRDRQRIQLDLEHRSEQWTRQGRAPIGLPTTSAAYKYGGFGTTEVVLYFDLVRSLLDKAWKLTDRRKSKDRNQLIDRLGAHCEGWLHQPYEAGETAAELIELERQRIPMISNGAHFDCDCPICRAEADGLFGSSPMFMWFDGHHLELEDEFAFSLYETQQEWEADRSSHEVYRSESETTNPTQKQDADHEQPLLGESVWETSYVDWNQVTSAERSTQESLFALAFPVAELVSQVKMRQRGRPHVDSLNHAYDQLRRSSDKAAARSAASHLCNTLEDLAHTYPDLLSRCADLQSHIDEVLRRFA